MYSCGAGGLWKFFTKFLYGKKPPTETGWRRRSSEVRKFEERTEKVLLGRSRAHTLEPSAWV